MFGFNSVCEIKRSLSANRESFEIARWKIVLDKIIAALVALLQAIPIFDRWFTKTPSEKKKKRVSNVRKRHNKFKKGPKK
jgi:hypothetical protein